MKKTCMALLTALLGACGDADNGIAEAPAATQTDAVLARAQALVAGGGDDHAAPVALDALNTRAQDDAEAAPLD